MLPVRFALLLVLPVFLALTSTGARAENGPRPETLTKEVRRERIRKILNETLKNKSPEEAEAFIRAVEKGLEESGMEDRILRQCAACDAELLKVPPTPVDLSDDPIARFIFKHILSEPVCSNPASKREFPRIAIEMANRYRRGAHDAGVALAQLVFWRSMQVRCLEKDKAELGEQVQNAIDEIIGELGELDEALLSPQYKNFLTELYFAIDWRTRISPLDGNLQTVFERTPSQKWELPHEEGDEHKWDQFAKSLLKLRNSTELQLTAKVETRDSALSRLRQGFTKFKEKASILIREPEFIRLEPINP